MAGKPQDPAQESVDQSAQHDEGFEGQQGYGVEYERERFQGDNVAGSESGRSGSYESGGYGGGQPTGKRGSRSGEQAVNPADPEAQQGQGGQ